MSSRRRARGAGQSPGGRIALAAIAATFVAISAGGCGDDRAASGTTEPEPTSATPPEGSDVASAEGVALEFATALGALEYSDACALSSRFYRAGEAGVDCETYWGAEHERAGEPELALADVVDSEVVGKESTVEIEAADAAVVVYLELEDDAWVVTGID